MDEISNRTTISNEYDYSNCLPTIECVTYLVEYMYNIYYSFIKMLNEDEEKNKQFKYEYRQWQYKRNYGEKFEVCIKEKTYNNIICKDLSSFKSAVDNGNIKNIAGMKIKMDIDFKRGVGENLDEYENSFYISFEPANIKFTRKSDHIESEMTQIENGIKMIMDKFPTVNTIFCAK